MTFPAWCGVVSVVEDGFFGTAGLLEVDLLAPICLRGIPVIWGIFLGGPDGFRVFTVDVFCCLLGLGMEVLDWKGAESTSGRTFFVVTLLSPAACEVFAGAF